MPFTVQDITVPWTIKWDDWQVSATQPTATATIPFLVDFADHATFISEVMGYPERVGGSAVFLFPLLYPFANGTLLAQSCDVQPLGAFTQNTTNTYGGVTGVFPTKVQVNVNFATVPYEIDTADGASFAFVSIDSDYSGDFVTNPGAGYKFVTSGKPVDKGVGFPVPQTKYVVTLHNLVEVDDDLFDGYIGKVNGDQFILNVKGKSINRPPGTVLFVGASDKQQGTTGEDPKYQVEMTFLARPEGFEFNKLFDPTTGLRDYVVVQSGADDEGTGDEGEVQSIYEEIEMMPLFDGPDGQ
jgi:hypothetical protein